MQLGPSRPPHPGAQPASGGEHTTGKPETFPWRMVAVDAAPAPTVQLGKLVHGGLAPAILAIVERGVQRRPVPARSLRAEVELSIQGGYPPVRVVFAERHVLVEDGAAVDPDLRVIGALGDLIGLMVAPAVRGVPLPINARGRAALGMVALKRVRFEGRIGLVRRLLALIRV